MQSQLYWRPVEMCVMFIEHVCSVSMSVDYLTRSYCEWIDVVHANPAGDIQL